MRRSIRHRSFVIVVTCLLPVLGVSSLAQAQSLQPYKDDLFAYPQTLKSEDNGAYLAVDYQEARDINERDEVPERRVKKAYVSLGVRGEQQDLKLSADIGDVRFVAVGKTEGASIITVYLHGKGGSRKQGVDDFTFGGNFNRIKNLMVDNSGLYLSPDFSDFDERGEAEVAALIAHYAAASPSAKVFVACGSMGGYICWKLAADPGVSPRLSGLMLLGSVYDETFKKTAAFKRKMPVFFGHGSQDTVFPVEGQEANYKALKSSKGGYPVRFVRFETGSHGTPIRMTDWRDTLNWMLALSK